MNHNWQLSCRFNRGQSSVKSISMSQFSKQYHDPDNAWYGDQRINVSFSEATEASNQNGFLKSTIIVKLKKGAFSLTYQDAHLPVQLQACARHNKHDALKEGEAMREVEASKQREAVRRQCFTSRKFRHGNEQKPPNICDLLNILYPSRWGVDEESKVIKEARSEDPPSDVPWMHSVWHPSRAPVGRQRYNESDEEVSHFKG